MGFIYHAIQLPRAITSAFFLRIFAHFRYLFTLILTHLGLYKPPPEEESEEANSRENYILILDGSSPSLIPIPIYVATAAIKTSLPIIEFHDLIANEEENEEIREEKICSICFDCVEWNEEVRKLCNCRHVFHRACLDTWIDEGQVTCPMCRAMLIAPKIILSYKMPRDPDAVCFDS